MGFDGESLGGGFVEDGHEFSLFGGKGSVTIVMGHFLEFLRKHIGEMGTEGTVLTCLGFRDRNSTGFLVGFGVLVVGVGVRVREFEGGAGAGWGGFGLLEIGVVIQRGRIHH